MARLSKHGEEIGRIKKLTSAKAYMSDGTVLENAGFGWKLRGQVKDGIPPTDAYQRAVVAYEAHLAERPCFAAYRAALHAECGLDKRWQLHQAIQMMPDDPDGVWSTMADMAGHGMDLDDAVKLCRLYRSAVEESDHFRRSKAA